MKLRLTERKGIILVQLRQSAGRNKITVVDSTQVPIAQRDTLSSVIMTMLDRNALPKKIGEVDP